MSDENEVMDEVLGAAAEAGELVGDEVDIDLSDGIASGNTPLIGKYPMEVVRSELKTSQAGNQYIKLSLRVFEGPNTNRWAFTNINLTGAGAKYGAGQLKALGYPVETQKVSVSSLVGLKGIAVCKADTREGFETETDVKDIRPYVPAGEAEDIK